MGRDSWVHICQRCFLSENLHLKQDKETAMVLWIPGTCYAEAMRLNLAAHRNKRHSRSITSDEWDMPNLKEWTTASLL